MDNLKILTIEEIESESVLWVWKPFIALGKTAIVQGNPGVGKSTAVLAIAADITRGTLPGESDLSEPAAVIYQTVEDGYADTVKPRLQRLGADCKRIHIIDDNEYPLSLSDERIEEAIVRTGAKLFIADPLQGFCRGAECSYGRKTSTGREHESHCTHKKQPCAAGEITGVRVRRQRLFLLARRL